MTIKLNRQLTELNGKAVNVWLKASNTTQIIATTHSAELVYCFSSEPEGVLVCEKGFDNETTFRRFSSFSGSPLVPVTIGGSRSQHEYEGIVHTGFTGFILLPVALAIPLGLELDGLNVFILADGRSQQRLALSSSRAHRWRF